MNKAKIIIGANFGDEGKGLMTDYFAYEANKNKKSCLVICHNGGSQKGHTVVAPSGLRHVFHHFGSGSFTNADTYLSREYIVNPIIFNKELKELNRKDAANHCYINKLSRITTPFEMMINQIIEEYRGDSKHGSCGLGIYETIIRDKDISITIEEFCGYSDLNKALLLSGIADNYIPKRLRELNIKSLPIKWVEILSHKDEIITNYIKDFNIMTRYIRLCDDSIVDEYEYVIFEGAQGLLLDQNNTEYMPNLTPSNTGIANPINIIGKRNCEVEVCYVTRTYMTRHGAGRFDSECNKAIIADCVIDLTNVPNPYQDTIRYGKLDNDLLIKTINRDLSKIPSELKYKTSLTITHVNETGNKIISTKKDITVDEFVKDFENKFSNIYLSTGLTREQVKHTAYCI